MRYNPKSRLWEMATRIRESIEVDDRSPLARAYDRVIRNNKADNNPCFKPSEEEIGRFWRVLKLDERLKKGDSSSGVDGLSSGNCSPTDIHGVLRDLAKMPEKKPKKSELKVTVIEKVKTKKTVKTPETVPEQLRTANQEAWNKSAFFTLMSVTPDSMQPLKGLERLVPKTLHSSLKQ
jgi:hypothetical protein